MKYNTKLQLAAVHQLCDALDKSTEYTFQLMQDTCNVSHDAVVNYFKIPQGEKQELFNTIISLTGVIIKLENMNIH